MSQAEYASKQVPVLTRLVTALRQIPAVEFAVAKFRSLLRGRTKTEPAVANAFVAPTSRVIDATPAPTSALDDTVEAEIAATVVAAETVERETAEPATDDHAPAVAAIVETVTILADPIDTDCTPVSVAEPDLTEAVAVAPEIVESKIAQATPVEADTVALPAVEPETVATQPSEADIVAFVGAAAEVVAPVRAIEAATPVAEPSRLSEREELIRRRWKETGVRMWNARTHGAGQATLCIQGSVKLLPPKPGETMPQYDRLEFQMVDGRIVCEGVGVDTPDAPRQRVFASAAG